MDFFVVICKKILKQKIYVSLNWINQEKFTFPSSTAVAQNIFKRES